MPNDEHDRPCRFCGRKDGDAPPALSPQMSEMERRIMQVMTPKGGFTRAGIESLGIKYPPAKGWKQRLIREAGGVPVGDDDGAVLE